MENKKLVSKSKINNSYHIEEDTSSSSSRPAATTYNKAGNYKRKHIKGSSELGDYIPPTSAILIPDGDTGFNFVKSKYKRFIWTWNEYIKDKPRFQKS